MSFDLVQEDDGALLRFLQSKFNKGKENGPEFFYDPKYALRLCLKQKRMRACVHIYSMMSMHEEAVALALQVMFIFVLSLFTVSCLSTCTGYTQLSTCILLTCICNQPLLKF